MHLLSTARRRPRNARQARSHGRTKRPIRYKVRQPVAASRGNPPLARRRTTREDRSAGRSDTPYHLDSCCIGSAFRRCTNTITTRRSRWWCWRGATPSTKEAAGAWCSSSRAQRSPTSYRRRCPSFGTRVSDRPPRCSAPPGGRRIQREPKVACRSCRELAVRMDRGPGRSLRCPRFRRLRCPQSRRWSSCRRPRC